jgi:hypothetical protein
LHQVNEMLHRTRRLLMEPNVKSFSFQGTDRNDRGFTLILRQTSEPPYRIAASVDEQHRNGRRAFERVEISTSVN